MSFGLHSAGATFQRLLDRVIGPELEPKAFAYLDDLIIVSKTFQEHLDLLKEVFQRLRTAGLKPNPEKCHFCKRSLKYLGHIVDEEGIRTDSDKVKAIRDFPVPKTIRALRSFLGLASWYRRFVRDFAKITRPMTKLLRKDAKWNWGGDEMAAFEELKTRLSTTPVLACPDFNQQFILQVDASNEGLGAALTQKIGVKEQAIAFASRLLSDGERKFTVTELECLALVWAVKKFRPYLEGYKFIAVTDHQALKWLMNIQQPSGRLARWVLELQQYDFEIRYRKGSLNKVADALSRYPAESSKTRAGCATIDSGCGSQERRKKSKQPNDWHSRMLRKLTKRPTSTKDLCLRDGRLFKYKSSGKYNVDETLNWKLCVPLESREAVLQEVHDEQTAGHLGIRKTISRAQKHYYWPGMNKDIRRYVRKCLTCQAYKVEQQKPAGKMLFRKPTGPWYTVTADLMGPFPRSKKGATFVLVVQDVYTKWIEIVALKSAKAITVSSAFQELILLRYGAPEVIITDNGSQFTSKLWKDLIQSWDIEHQLTAPYTPQENPVERANRVVKTMIAQYVKRDHKLWDVYLNEFRYAINTATHESTGYTPAMLNFGRELRVPKAIHGPILSNENETDWESMVRDKMGKLAKIRSECRANLEKAFQYQAKHYNLRRREVKYQTGDLVWLRQHHLSSSADAFTAKLAAKYDGPFVIIAKLSPNLYELQDQKKKSIGKAHVKDLKRYVA